MIVVFTDPVTGQVKQLGNYADPTLVSEGETINNMVARYDHSEFFATTGDYYHYYWNGSNFAKIADAPDDFNKYDWSTHTWSLDSDALWEYVREERAHLLLMCDWTQVSDAPLSDSKKAEWATYRQALRNMPATYASATGIADVIWPTPPS